MATSPWFWSIVGAGVGVIIFLLRDPGAAQREHAIKDAFRKR
jgi:hypothetical protein